MINNDKEINNYKKPMKRRIIFTEKAPLPVGPYNQAIMIGKVLYISGQIAINPETGDLNLETIEIETTLVMKNLKSILEAAKMNFENVIKSTIFISDMNNYSKINEVYGQFFNPENAPARETVEVSALPKGAKIEISVIAKK
mgnify:FL=1